MRLGRLLMIAGLTVLGFVTVAPAAQASSVKMACGLSGPTKFVDKEDPSWGMRPVGGSGRYTFTGTIGCNGSLKGAPCAAAMGITSQGYYHSVIMGTGKWVSDQPIQLNALISACGKSSSFWSAVLGRLWYSIEFAASTGQFFWDDGSTDKEVGLPKLQTDPKSTEQRSWVYGGQVHMGPPLPIGDKPGQVPTEGVKAVRLTGTILLDLT